MLLVLQPSESRVCNHLHPWLMAVPLTSSSTTMEMTVISCPHGMSPTQSIVPAPAPGGAGGQPAKSRRQELIELTVISTRLEALLRMYERLWKTGSGTGTVESEAMSVVWERVSGPTGHPLIVEGLSDVPMSQEESELVMRVKSGGQCWRDIPLVRKLISVRMDVVRKQWNESKAKHSMSARVLSATIGKEEMKEIWVQVQEIRRETWKTEDSCYQKKTSHLSKKARDCSKHNTCARINQLVTDRAKTWMLGESSQPRERESGATSETPRLRPVYLGREEDLKQLQEEEEHVLALAEEYNMKLVKTKEEEIQDEVLLVGDVKLSDDEVALLNLGPGYMMTKTLDVVEMEVEAVVTLTKIRWGRRSKGMEDMTDKEISEFEAENPTNEEEEDLADMIETTARDVVEEESKAVNMSKKRATDMKNNRHVHMPGPASPKIEASHNTRMGVWLSEFGKFKARNCNEAGEQKLTNLSNSQQLALKSLGKKVAKLEVILLEADKGERFVAVDQGTYLAMAQDHTSKDRTASKEEVRASQRLLSTTGKAIINIFGVGQDQGYKNYGRCFDNVGSETEDAPVLKIVPKTHKKPTEAGHPASRPIVAAATGISSRAGDIMADVLGPLILMTGPRHEDQSTEEVIAQLEGAQAAVQESGCVDTMVGSLDVSALYPSLDQEQASEIVAQLVRESPVKFANVNYRCAQTFLASHYSELELKSQDIHHLVPARLHKGGRRPGPTTLELSTKLEKDFSTHPESKWSATNPEVDLDDTQKRLLLSRVVKTAVKVIFANHIYQFAGVLFIQLVGGPIGLRLTSIVARIVMDRWSMTFQVKLDKTGWKIWSRMKYVDDINLVLRMRDQCLEWVDGVLVKMPEPVIANESREAHTMRLVKELAESILPLAQIYI